MRQRRSTPAPNPKRSRCGCGKLEDVERSESEHITLRVFIGQQSASIGSSDLGDAALEELAARAIAMARLAPEDPYAGLAPAELLARGPLPALDLLDADELSPAAVARPGRGHRRCGARGIGCHQQQRCQRLGRA